MKIWLPELGRIYKTVFDNQEVFIRFTAYGVSKATAGRPIDLTFVVYEDISCKKVIKNDTLSFQERWELQQTIYNCEFENTGVVIERLNEKKFPDTLPKLLHALSLKSNKSARMGLTIVFKDHIKFDKSYSYRASINKLDDGSYTYGYFASRYPKAYVESFTPDDVVEIQGKVLGKRFKYVNGEITWE